VCIIAIDSCLPATFLCQGQHCINRWRCDTNETIHFLHGGDDFIDFERPASFEVLQPRCGRRSSRQARRW
jgi:hypothetical protein